jgi:hypothetical protein
MEEARYRRMKVRTILRALDPCYGYRMFGSGGGKYNVDRAREERNGTTYMLEHSTGYEECKHKTSYFP